MNIDGDRLKKFLTDALTAEQDNVEKLDDKAQGRAEAFAEVLDAFHSSSFAIKEDTPEKCQPCRGTGYCHYHGFPDDLQPCEYCRGTGYKEDTPKQECDWCGEPDDELSHPHTFDMAPGAKMCRNCWNHDREAYKGSYGEDIGEFKPVKEE